MSDNRNFESPDFRNAYARYIDGNCDGRLQSTEYISMVREATDRIIADALAKHDEFGKSLLDGLASIDEPKTRKNFADFRDLEGSSFPNGIESLSSTQYKDLGLEIRSRGKTAQAIYKEEGVFGRIYYEVPSFFGGAYTALSLDLAEISTELSKQHPSMFPACRISKGKVRR
jgi:hypothetical protein